MFRIEMLPARQGDALWIEYGDPQYPRRVLYDAGTPSSWTVLKNRIERLAPEDRRFELLIVSHIDTDHVGGVLPLLEDGTLGTQIDDIWFNGFRHLPGTLEPMGPIDGERLTRLILDRGRPWNEAFGRRAVVVTSDAPLPTVTLPGGMKLTVLSPTLENLTRLRPVWESVVRDAGLDPVTPPPETEPLPPALEALGVESVDQLAARPFKTDTAEANGSSIAVLAEFGGHRALLCADAFPRTILDGVERLRETASTDRLRVDALKLPHHGSRANLSPGLLERVQCQNHLISSDGTQTRHPNPEAVARVVVTQDRPRLLFNYRTRFTEIWDPTTSPIQARSHEWSADFPADADVGLAVDMTDTAI